VRITYDPAKREKTLRERGLDFKEAKAVFAGRTLTIEDRRQDYGEDRYLTFGHLCERVVAIVWTPRGSARRVISMRKCHDREIEKYEIELG
jgi:uncharacterized DUF497 family protein